MHGCKYDCVCLRACCSSTRKYDEEFFWSLFFVLPNGSSARKWHETGIDSKRNVHIIANPIEGLLGIQREILNPAHPRWMFLSRTFLVHEILVQKNYFCLFLFVFLHRYLTFFFGGIYSARSGSTTVGSQRHVDGRRRTHTLAPLSRSLSLSRARARSLSLSPSLSRSLSLSPSRARTHTPAHVSIDTCI